MLTPDERKLPDLEDSTAAWAWATLNMPWIYSVLVKSVNARLLRDLGATIGFRGGPYSSQFRWTGQTHAVILHQPLEDLMASFAAAAVEHALVAYDRSPTKDGDLLFAYVQAGIDNGIGHEITRERVAAGLQADEEQYIDPSRPMPDASLSYLDKYDEGDEDYDPDVEARAEAQSAMIAAALDTLTDNERRALELRADGYNDSDIAELLGLYDRSAAWKIWKRAVDKMQAAIDIEEIA